MVSLAAISASIMISVYLLAIWKRQSTRLYTDLPLMFGIVFLAYSVNMFIQILPQTGIIEASIELFKVRTVTIGATVLPMLSMLMHILLPKYSQHHKKVMAAVVIYWFAVTLFGPTEQLIMSMLIPVVVVVIIGLTITFTITWRTGRLKEVRSDLVVASLVLLFISQTSKVPLVGLGLGFIADILTATGTIIVTLAMANPWYKRKSKPISQAEEIHSVAA